MRDYFFQAGGPWQKEQVPREKVRGSIEARQKFATLFVSDLLKCNAEGAELKVRQRKEWSGDRFNYHIPDLIHALQEMGMDVRKASYGLFANGSEDEWERTHPLPSQTLSTTLTLPGKSMAPLGTLLEEIYFGVSDNQARVSVDFLPNDRESLLGIDIVSDMDIERLRSNAAHALEQVRWGERPVWEVQEKK